MRVFFSAIPFFTFAVLFFSSVGVPESSSHPIQMIFWEKQSWESNGPSSRVMLWADGQSEIRVKQWGNIQKTKPGWEAVQVGGWATYIKKMPYPYYEARDKFNAAIAAGIEDLREFPPGYSDGSGTLVGIERDGKVKQTTIPMFLHEGQKDNKGSKNHKKFLAVEAILGKFDDDPISK